MGGIAQMFRRITYVFICILLLLSSCHQPEKAIPLNPTTPSSQTRQKTKNHPKEIKKKEKEPQIEFKKLHYVIYEKGRLKWKISASRAIIYEGQKIKIEGLKVFSDPKKGIIISADRAYYDVPGQTFVFKGHVSLQTISNGKLETSKLVYCPAKDLIQTKALVKIKNQGIFIVGKGLVYHLRTGRFKLLHQTKVLING